MVISGKFRPSSWVILPSRGPLQQAIFFVVNAMQGRGLHAAHRWAHRMDGLAPPRCRNEFRTLLQGRAASSEQRAKEHSPGVEPTDRETNKGPGRDLMRGSVPRWVGIAYDRRDRSADGASYAADADSRDVRLEQTLGLTNTHR